MLWTNVARLIESVDGYEMLYGDTDSFFVGGDVLNHPSEEFQKLIDKGDKQLGSLKVEYEIDNSDAKYFFDKDGKFIEEKKVEFLTNPNLKIAIFLSAKSYCIFVPDKNGNGGRWKMKFKGVMSNQLNPLMYRHILLKTSIIETVIEDSFKRSLFGVELTTIKRYFADVSQRRLHKSFINSEPVQNIEDSYFLNLNKREITTENKVQLAKDKREKELEEEKFILEKYYEIDPGAAEFVELIKILSDEVDESNE